MNGIKAVFVDLDGTLLNPQHAISPYTLDVLDKLQNRLHVLLIVATGRPYPDVFAKLKKVHLRPDFIITSNGARIHDKDHKKVFGIDLDPAAVFDILQLKTVPGEFKKDEPIPEGYMRPFVANINCEDKWITDYCLEWTRKAFEPEYTYAPSDPSSFTVADMVGTHSIWIRGLDREALATLKRYIDEKWGHAIHTVYSTPVIIDCHPPSVNKGVAVRKVSELLGFDPLTEAISFGDGMNDEPMLTAVRCGFIMKNANPSLKSKLAKMEVIRSNKDDGVAHKLAEIFNLDSTSKI